MPARPLSDLRTAIQREVDAQAHLHAIRDYNRAMIAELTKIFPLPGKALLDLGASIHGYALEAALDAGVKIYEGIDLDVSRHWSAATVEFAEDGCRGRLMQMNAENLAYEDETFDCLFSISTFEHFLTPETVLAEMFRVLRAGGVALLSFEPIWTAANGHHLHHFGAVSDLVPPWSHLFLGEEEMREILTRSPWPADASISMEDAIQWIYRGLGINRLGIRQLRNVFETSPFDIGWIHPLPDVDEIRLPIAEYVSRVTGYDADELRTRGLSVLLRKE